VRGDDRLDFVGIREASQSSLREDQLAVESHFKDPVAPLDELRLDAELAPDLVRQTGGSG